MPSRGAFAHKIDCLSAMVHRILSTFLLVGALLGVETTAFAQSSSDQRAAEVRELLEERDREIKHVLGDKDTFTAAQRERLKDVINAGIDFEGMGRTALGSFWSEITPSQRADFVDVFGAIVRNQSLSNLDAYRSSVTYNSVKVEGDSARVVTSTVYKGVPTEVVYILGLREDQWRVRDIILDDVSTAEGYARSFQTVVRKRGFDALMQSLHKKLDSMSS